MLEEVWGDFGLGQLMLQVESTKKVMRVMRDILSEGVVGGGLRL